MYTTTQWHKCVQLDVSYIHWCPEVPHIIIMMFLKG